MLSPSWIGFIVGGVIGSTFPLIFGLVLYILGFGCIGITAGTCAAAVMSACHPIAGGSIYAYFQSCGMTFPWGPLIYIILGGAGAGAGYYIGDTYFDNGGGPINSSFVDLDHLNVTAATFLYPASSDLQNNSPGGAGKH